MKPRNEAQHQQWLEEGKSWPIKVHAPQVFRSPAGDPYFRDDDGNFYDRHLKLIDRKGFLFYGNLPKSGIQKIGRILLGAAGVFVGIRSPQNKALQGVLKLFGSDPDAVVAKVAPLGLNAQALIFIADIVGWDKAAAWGHELERMASDGKISVAEFARLHQIRDNKVDPGDPTPPPAPEPDPAIPPPDPTGSTSEPAPDPAPAPDLDPSPHEETETAPDTPPAAPTPEDPGAGEPSDLEAGPDDPGASDEETPDEPAPDPGE